MVNRRNLDTLTRGASPALRASTPDWDVLRGLVDRSEQAIADARRREVGMATRFSSAYSAAFWLARTAVEAAGYRLDDIHRFRNRFDYGDIVDVPETRSKY